MPANFRNCFIAVDFKIRNPNKSITEREKEKLPLDKEGGFGGGERSKKKIEKKCVDKNVHRKWRRDNETTRMVEEN
jgi:hypothetical protein